ncbi:alpha-xenorhabdolysin family binary toxin subunit A [Pseudomonas reidholzensis]|nr:alpha-xenorhabdolysin family binary toxin subunit A [Pseudomonas reidholzensis]
MDDRNGEGQAGLILTVESRQTINDYSLRMLDLPADHLQTTRWLGYTHITEPELTPDRMLALFKRLRAHGQAWSQLDRTARAVTLQLDAHAGQVEACGAQVVQLVARTRALGAHRPSWDSLRDAPDVPLDEHDRRLVGSMAGQLIQLHGLIDDFDLQLDGVRMGFERFRDEARFKLRPEVLEKCRAAERFAQAPDGENLAWELASLDEDIRAVRGDYERYSRQSSIGWAGGPFGALVSSSIYGPKAKAARAELQRLEQRRSEVSRRLSEFRRVEGRVQEVNSNMGQLEFDLWDVVLAAGHLHTAWQTIEAYLESAAGHLGKMNTRQQLAVFIYYFRQFLAQWAGIREHGLEMAKVFN